jgi:hypothetical protein
VPWNPNTPGSTAQPDNQYDPSTPSPVVASAARTTSGSSTALDCSGWEAVGLELVITAASGTTPSLAVTVQWSNDGTNWADADVPDAFAARTAAGRSFRNALVKARYLRIAWAITGTTPSFTFAVNALAVY